MGKVLVLYHSASGNTAKMAALVAEGAALIPDIEVRLREVARPRPCGAVEGEVVVDALGPLAIQAIKL
jgi:multimeric flavodoxin WrbA